MLGPAPAGRIGGAGSLSPIGAGGKAPAGPSPGPGSASGGAATAPGALRCAMSRGSSISGAGGKQAVAGLRRGQELWRRRRLADAPGASVGRAVIGEIEMDVVVVEHVRTGTQDGGEILAGARVDLVHERGFLGVGLLPVVDEVDLPAVGEREAGDVDGIAEGVLRQPRAGY